jgi:hypothetical protein
MPGAVDEHISRHVAFLPFFGSGLEWTLLAPTTITKAGRRNHPRRIVEIASVVNAIIEPS